MHNNHNQPPVHPFTDVRLDVPPVEHLSNGISIRVVNAGHDGVNRLSVFVRGGVLHEQKPMLAAFTALTALEGTQTQSAQQIAEKLDYYGAWKSAQAYDEWVEIAFSSLNDNYQASLDVLCDCLTQPAFRVYDLAQLQRRHAASCAAALRQVKYLASVKLRELYYGASHPLAASPTPESILDFKVDQLADFHQNHYCTANMAVVLAGQITDDIRRRTDDTLGRLLMPGKATPAFDWSTFSQPAGPQQLLVHLDDAVQSAIAIAIPAVKRGHPDYFKIRILATVFGGYFGSRLMSNVREQKGYTYGINAFLAGREHDGFIGINTECDVEHTHDVLAEICREMRRLREEPVADVELQLVRQYMLGDLVKTLDTPFSVGSYVSSIITFGMYPEYFNDQVRDILAVTAADLLEMARQYLREERMITVIAGDCNRLRKYFNE